LRIKLDLRLAVDQRGFAEIFEAALKAFHTKELSIGASGIFDRSGLSAEHRERPRDQHRTNGDRESALEMRFRF